MQIKRKARRMVVVVSAALTVLALSVIPAFAVDPTTPAEVIDQLADQTKSNFYSIIPKNVELMGIFIGVVLGFVLVKRAVGWLRGR